MAGQRDHRTALKYLRSKVNGTFASSKPIRPMSPPSVSTEILDTDIDSDSQPDSMDDSSRSVLSLDTSSVTTASTPDDVKTPGSTGLTSFHFHIDDNPISGPEGPHLFRLSNGSMEIKSTVEIDLIFGDESDADSDVIPYNIPTSTYEPGRSFEPAPIFEHGQTFEPGRRDTPVPCVANPRTPLQTVLEDPAEPDGSQVVNWNPQTVVSWLQKMNFDDGVIEKFFINDITGAILLELEQQDLKELDIQSFGKRHQLMASIRSLRNGTYSNVSNPSLGSEPVSREPTPNSMTAEVGARSCNATPVGSRSCNATPVACEATSPQTENDEFPSRRQRRRRRAGAIGPNDSVSIVGIEQLLPKVHRCSKGEECRKWQKQHARVTRFPQDASSETMEDPIVTAGDTGSPSCSRNMVKSPKSEVTPSIVASSHALGPKHVSEMPISEEQLDDVESRDPQENVRNFLNFQRLSRLQPVTDPATPPIDVFPSPDADSPGSLAEQLRSLPRLRIPSSHGLSPRSAGALSGQRTITPSVLRKKENFQPPTTAQVPTPYTAIFSPSDYYRQDSHYGLTSPFSEVDVPMTAIPSGPVERRFSQSVPPDMRFGNYMPHRGADPIERPGSTKDNHRRKMSQPYMRRLDEGRMMSPIETPEDLERTPRAGNYRYHPFSPTGEPSDEIIHSGWMKKRKTTRLFRHEWNEHVFALRGTQLSMFTTEHDAQNNWKALEHIDVDDYAVACSSLASSSKLTAAFKRTILKRTDDTRGGTAFAFSLIPSPTSMTAVERKTLFSNGLKSHHFAVPNGYDRITWMREVMLAKALRRGREIGASMNMNGNVI
ncbi:Sterile alpha motif type 2 [Penicillium verhagenii]|uniref:Sterile alpha motif type 2 n=1 Tax=Penicillium verhagenii TaxID=1562060 RepID=UPI0025455467|nr:Sterile alpha motif type 2 [Penicillium verhagenii]KAJ5928739.1 Sterile alpha motif type 2 [Penicillium verhagenii]